MFQSPFPFSGTVEEKLHDKPFYELITINLFRQSQVKT